MIDAERHCPGRARSERDRGNRREDAGNGLIPGDLLGDDRTIIEQRLGFDALGDVARIDDDPSNGWIAQPVIAECLEVPPVAGLRYHPDGHGERGAVMGERGCKQLDGPLTVVGMDVLEDGVIEDTLNLVAEHCRECPAREDDLSVAIDDTEDVRRVRDELLPARRDRRRRYLRAFASLDTHPRLDAPDYRGANTMQPVFQEVVGGTGGNDGRRGRIVNGAGDHDERDVRCSLMPNGQRDEPAERGQIQVTDNDVWSQCERRAVIAFVIDAHHVRVQPRGSKCCNDERRIVCGILH